MNDNIAPNEGMSGLPQQKKMNKWVKIALFGGVALVVALLLASFLYAQFYSNVFPGATLMGEKVGGLTERQLESLLEEKETALKAENFLLEAENASMTVPAEQLIYSFGTEKAQEQLMAVGRDGNAIQNTFQAVSMLFGKQQDVAISATPNTDKIHAVVEELYEKAVQAVDPASYTMEDDKLEVYTGKNGVNFDKTAFSAELIRKSRSWRALPLLQR